MSCLRLSCVVFLGYVLFCSVTIFQMQPGVSPFFDKNAAILANFSELKPPGEEEFFFGLATAPAHVEDQLEDCWLEFAKGHHGVLPVRAWHNIQRPEERLRFWSQAEVELQLARDTGVTVFRLGIDWGRIVPFEPVNGTIQAVDYQAVEQYKKILQSIRDHGMRVMLTLFHHSMPKWALRYGGWSDKRTVDYFEEFVRFSKEHFGSYVDYWITFNEPHIFVLLTHCSGTWPPGVRTSLLGALICFSPLGDYGKAIRHISYAHIAAYKVLHESESSTPVGVAHHVGVIKPYGLLDVPLATFSRWMTEFHWIDYIQNHLDFCGINYYGQEILSVAGLMIDDQEEYSEAGRGVYPDGLLEVLTRFHQRYRIRRPQLRYIITENGIADSRDVLRRPYLVEHLLAVSVAAKQGIPVDGYIHWTISDNWEWADGYCPKFGLVRVDRTTPDLHRLPRPSYYLFQQIIKEKVVRRETRIKEWSILEADIKGGGLRPFCRVVDPNNVMWADGLDTPVMRPISRQNWRFHEYKTPRFTEYVQRSVNSLQVVFTSVLWKRNSTS